MIVVDLGCYDHGVYDSVGALVEHYQPELLYGFDPLCDDTIERVGDTVVVTRALAAWVWDGLVGFDAGGGTGSTVTSSEPNVPCFDLAKWLVTLPGDVIVKMDVEGAELPLCGRLKRRRVDERLTLLLVETHGSIELPALACPVEEWWM